MAKINSIRIKAGDIPILLFILFLSIFFIVKSKKKDAGYISVNANGKFYEYSLKHNANYKFEGPLGFTEVEVKDGKVRIISSPCPNKTCISRGFADLIVCLPNRIMVKVEGMEDFDAVSE